MSVETYQGIIKNGLIKLIVNVKLPENRKVSAVIPDDEEKPEFEPAKMAAETSEDYTPHEENFGKSVGKEVW